jgi:hypothetical protein
VAQTSTQIAADAIATVSAETSLVTNFNVGSVVRSLIDAFASESSLMEQEIEEQVAAGILNAPYQLLNLSPSGAVGSVYLLTFSLSSSATSNVTLASGTSVTIPNSTLQWEIGQSITLEPGQSSSISATCTTTGTITNVPANSITQLVVPVSGITVTNASAQPVIQGRDAQTQSELQAELSQTINQLHRGDYLAVEAGALTSQLVDASGKPTEQVVNAVEVDFVPTTAWQVNGFVYVYNGVGAMSSELLQQTQNIVNGYTDTNGVKHTGYKAAGVILQVVDAPQSVVDLSLAVLPKYGYSLATVQTNVQDAVNRYFASLDIGQAFSLTQLAYAVLTAPGVADVQITEPTNSLPATPYVANPATAPTLSAVSGSTALASGTYTVAYAYNNPYGQTLATASSAVTISSGEAIGVASVPLETGATGVEYYLSVSAGSTTLGYVATSSGQAFSITGLPSAGAASPPTENTAQIPGNVYVLGSLSITEATS